MYSNRNYLVVKITSYYKPSNREALVTEALPSDTHTHTYLVSASDAGVCAPGGGDTAARELLRPALLRALLLRPLSDLDVLSLLRLLLPVGVSSLSRPSGVMDFSSSGSASTCFSST